MQAAVSYLCHSGFFMCITCAFLRYVNITPLFLARYFTNFGKTR